MLKTKALTASEPLAFGSGAACFTAPLSTAAPVLSTSFLCVFLLAGCQLPSSPRVSIDDVLHRTDERHGTFGPTGRRLFTERREPGLGVRGQYCYIHHADIRDPILLELHDGDEALPMRDAAVDWYPSHLAVRSRVGQLAVTEQKFITDDDALVELLTLTNDTLEPVHYDLHLASRFATRLDRRGSTFSTVDISASANAHPFPGFDVFTGARPKPFRAWYEAERTVAQYGPSDVDKKSAASNGEVLGMHFGSSASHFATIAIATPGLANARLYLRYARTAPDGAESRLDREYAIQIDGVETATLSVKPTRGWGEDASHYEWASADLGRLSAGGHLLTIRPVRGGSNINIDGFYIAAEPFELPTVRERLEADPIRQIAYRPAREIIEGVPFQFIDPAENKARGAIIARPSSEGAESTADTEFVIPIPDSGAKVIHFCGQIAADVDSLDEDEPVAEYVLTFDDGLTERILLTRKNGLVPTWGWPGVLSYELPDERSLVSVTFRSTGYPGDAALLGITLETFPESGPNYHFVGSRMFHGVRAHAVLAATGFSPHPERHVMVRPIRLLPGESVTLPIVMAMTENLLTSEELAHQWEVQPDPLTAHRRTYQAWFDENCPTFTCDDPYVEKMYWYRWYVARQCLSRAKAGALPHPYFFEGTRESHFPRLIAFSSPHIIAETRWLRDPQYAFGQVRNHVLNADEQHHFFISARIDEARGDYNNWITQAAWRAFWVHPDEAFLKEVVAALAGDVLGTLRAFDPDDDGLPASRNHWSTGMEFQPSFWYFDGFDNTKPDAKMERGDFAAYLYGNAMAVADAYRYLGLTDEAARFERVAERTRDACLRKMWDEKDRFFYGILQDDDAVAPVREIVGFYPFMSRIPPNQPQYTATLAYLVDEDEFWTAYPPATASKQVPVYSPSISKWPGPGGRTHGCMWNGPTWPHATSVILDIAAIAIRQYDQRHITPDVFWRMFDRYTHVQFEGDDLDKPLVQEYFDAETAFPEGVPDYFHSTYCDLVIRHLVGIQPSNSNALNISPIAGPFERFALRGLKYRGHELDVVYNNTGDMQYGPRGLGVWIDGKLAGRRSSLGAIQVKLPEDESAKRRAPRPELDIYGNEIRPE